MAEAAPIYEGAVDRGLEGVVACSTAISFIVGATLNYRGYTIEDLAEHSTFEEVVFLLWNNRLPKKDELDNLKSELGKELAARDVPVPKRCASHQRVVPPRNGDEPC